MSLYSSLYQNFQYTLCTSFEASQMEKTIFSIWWSSPVYIEAGAGEQLARFSGAPDRCYGYAASSSKHYVVYCANFVRKDGRIRYRRKSHLPSYVFITCHQVLIEIMMKHQRKMTSCIIRYLYVHRNGYL